ncbi:MAG: amino acid ABC transporter substrate-binding protein [Chloroflexi bacterium]|nr:amino acid ABC transporter substrate-binding protein [Chloroflexota bacterium]
MRRAFPITTLLLASLALGACTSGATTAPSSAAPSVAPSVAASVAASIAPSPSVDACAKDSLTLKTAGKLTIGTDNPAYPPYYATNPAGNAAPWDKDQGDPNTGEGFESAVAYAVAEQLGFAKADVVWVVAPFNTAIAPGPKAFDFDINQVSFTPERAESNDLTEGYYEFNQTVVVRQDSAFATVKSVAGLKDAKLGAQVGTTSLAAIQNDIKPTTEASVYDSNDAAIQALQAKQIDGILVDLPTAYFLTTIQAPDTAIAGQLGTAAGGAPEHFSLLLDKDSALTPCLNTAIGALQSAGTLDELRDKWLPDKTSPVAELQP